MKACGFDKEFDAGDDLDAQVDWSRARPPNVEVRRVEVDFNALVVDGLDREANRPGITRQSLIRPGS